ncbi:hypothetical protein V2J09_005019 [Rumex salicifolius]
MKLYDPTKQDELRWFYSKDDFFSVRSAYSASLIPRKLIGLLPSSASAVAAMWRKMWSLNIQPHVRSFLWRACKRILPTKVNLVERKVCADDECDMCRMPESKLHALGHYIEAKKFWRLLPKQAKWISWAAMMTELLDYMCSVGKPEDMEIWTVERSPIQGNWWRSVKPLCRNSNLADYNVGWAYQNRYTKWKKPIEGVVKVNYDAVVSKNNGCGIGFVARNHLGEALFMGEKIVNFSEEAEWAEAVLWAMEESQDQGYNNIMVESDCLALISKLMKNCRWKGFYGWILEKIHLMKSEFSTCLWSHIGRNGNQLTHLLASLRPNVELLADFSCSFSTLLKNLLPLDSQ